jgi:MATE family multidrug resistance protein
VLKKVIRYCFYWCLGFALLYSILFLLAEQPLLRLFTDQKEIIIAAREYMPYVIAYPVLGFLSYLWDGVFIGLTASRAMRNSMALSFIFFLVAYIGLLPIWGAHGIWAAMLIFMLFRGLVQTLQWQRKGIYLT